MTITITANIRAGRFKAIAQRVEQAFQSEAEEIKRLEETTTATWSNPPVFTIRRVAGGGLRAFIGPTGDAARIWHFLDGGTAIRYATMSPGFSPKTRTRVLGSFAGSGGVAFISRKHPRPGIKAREWRKLIKEQRSPIFRRNGKAALKG